MFAGFGAEATRESFHRLSDKLHSGSGLFRGLSRKDVVGDLLVKDAVFAAAFLLIRKSPIISLASQQNGVDCRIELAHAVINRARTAIEPFHVAIRASDVAVSTHGDVDDDFSGSFHE